jgi:hypothetical protein
MQISKPPFPPETKIRLVGCHGCRKLISRFTSLHTGIRLSLIFILERQGVWVSVAGCIVHHLQAPHWLPHGHAHWPGQRECSISRPLFLIRHCTNCSGVNGPLCLSRQQSSRVLKGESYLRSFCSFHTLCSSPPYPPSKISPHGNIKISGLCPTRRIPVSTYAMKVKLSLCLIKHYAM